MKTKSFIFYALSLALVAVFALVPDVAMAQDTGAGLLDDIQNLFGSNLGTVIGLGISLFGLWMWLVQQSSWGLIILIFGAALTAFPGIFGSMQSAFKGAFSGVGAGEEVGNGN